MPGEAGLSHIYFENPDAIPDDAEYEFEASTSAADTDSYITAPMAIRGERIWRLHRGQRDEQDGCGNHRPLRRLVGKEHSNIAGGRADVIVTFDVARRYVTEVKREFGNAARENLEAACLAQAIEYQPTNEPLGQLLVLDLTDPSGGTPHINDSIWVKHRRDVTGKVSNSAVIAVGRGNRPTPSAMK